MIQYYLSIVNFLKTRQCYGILDRQSKSGTKQLNASSVNCHEQILKPCLYNEGYYFNI